MADQPQPDQPESDEPQPEPQAEAPSARLEPGQPDCAELEPVEAGPVDGEPTDAEPGPALEPTGLELGRPRRRVGILVGIAAFVLAVDIATKAVVVATLSDRAPISLLGGFLHLRMDRNPGAAFSIGTSLTALYSLIAIAVIVVILRTSRRIRSVPWAITLGLLLGGAAGNLGDRIFRAPGLFRGWVVDWIQLPHWPVFNLADSAIVCGGILAVLLSARGIRLDGQRENQ